MDLEGAVRQELIAALEGGNAHARFEDVVANFPARLRGEKPSGEKGSLPYSAWQLLEHIRLAQNDILRFCNNQDGSYREMNFPDDYWPKAAAPPGAHAWDQSVAAVLSDREAMIRSCATGAATWPPRLPGETDRTSCARRSLSWTTRRITLENCWRCGVCSASGPRSKFAEPTFANSGFVFRPHIRQKRADVGHPKILD